MFIVQGVAVRDSAHDGTVDRQAASGSAIGGDLPWGFARGMPTLDELFDAAAAVAAPAGTADGAASAAEQAGRSHLAGGANDVDAAEEAGSRHQSLYMRRLQDSRAFHCPDATECMAEALGAKDALQSLQVEVALPVSPPCYRDSHVVGSIQCKHVLWS